MRNVERKTVRGTLRWATRACSRTGPAADVATGTERSRWRTTPGPSASPIRSDAGVEAGVDGAASQQQLIEPREGHGMLCCGQRGLEPMSIRAVVPPAETRAKGVAAASVSASAKHVSRRTQGLAVSRFMESKALLQEQCRKLIPSNTVIRPRPSACAASRCGIPGNLERYHSDREPVTCLFSNTSLAVLSESAHAVAPVGGKTPPPG